MMPIAKRFCRPSAPRLATRRFSPRLNSAAAAVRSGCSGPGPARRCLPAHLLGVIVGTVIVAQTLYSSTKDHLNEFATLRAMGSSNGYIYNVIIYQALLNAVIGFCFAAGIGAIVVQMTAKSALPIVITPWLVAGLAVLTVAMCVASAIGAIVRVLRIDPATVFMR